MDTGEPPRVGQVLGHASESYMVWENFTIHSSIAHHDQIEAKTVCDLKNRVKLLLTVMKTSQGIQLSLSIQERLVSAPFPNPTPHLPPLMDAKIVKSLI